MNAPELARATPLVESRETSYRAFADRLRAQGILDPWFDGKARFSEPPIILTRSDASALAGAAESVAAVLDEMCRIVGGEPALLDEFFRMTAVQKLLFGASFPLWHVHARADVFFRHEKPPVVCEINCDTPSGHSEAVALNRIALKDGALGLTDPCGELLPTLAHLTAAFAEREAPVGELPTIGIVYPTEMTEDLAFIALLENTFRARGHDVVLGSPYNLHAMPDGGVGLFGREVDLVVRHYKTDWWGEREPIWRDEEPCADPDPLEGPLRLLIRAEFAGRVTVVNPFGAVLPQNKRSFAFLWEELRRFGPEARRVIEAHVPFSVRLETADLGELTRERTEWVLKSDYGCEGDEVLLGALMTEGDWREALELAIPKRWIAQRRFDSVRDAAGRSANYGVYLLAGRAAGFYTRLSEGPTDPSALSVPTLVEA